MAAMLVLVTDLPHRVGFRSATCLLSFIARTGTTGSRGNQSMGHPVSQSCGADYSPPPQLPTRAAHCSRGPPAWSHRQPQVGTRNGDRARQSKIRKVLPPFGFFPLQVMGFTMKPKSSVHPGISLPVTCLSSARKWTQIAQQQQEATRKPSPSGFLCEPKAVLSQHRSSPTPRRGLPPFRASVNLRPPKMPHLDLRTDQWADLSFSVTRHLERGSC